MSAVIIDGIKIAQDIRTEVSQSVNKLQSQFGIVPRLAVVLVGEDPASAVYIRSKERACLEVGIQSETFKLPQDTTQKDLLDQVDTLNNDTRVHGILVQLPLPTQLDERSITLALNPQKDVDGLHRVNMGRLVEGDPLFVPCTPAGIQQLLMRTGHNPEGKHVVVCGRSEIVGKPISILMMQKREGANATVTICHTGTIDMAEITRSADILVVAIGRPKIITSDMVKKGAVVIDVGINRVEDATRKRGYRIEGDVDFEGVSEKAAAITPVPGGVGPMTVAMLLLNTLKAAERAVQEHDS